MKIVLFFVFLVMLGSTAYAAIPVTGTVSRIYPSGSSDRVNFKLRTSDCSGNPYFSFQIDTDIGKANFALLLAAATTKSEVIVAVNTCPKDGENGHVEYIYQDYPAS
ncbi:hypothetical protein SAMN02745866_04329 [Alteromonadaceae bacterium Bs31]|nr:hypothetical protein SAMN02745866_04329 [Alteromonadaceae bacterium Bs31]